MTQLIVLGRDLKSLPRRKIMVWLAQSVVTAGNLLRPSFVCSAFAELRLHFPCSQELMSRPQFNVATSFLLRCHSVVSSIHAGRDSKLLGCLFSYRDVEFRSRPSIFFALCNSCHNLKIMSRQSLLSIQSQPHFLVSIFHFNFSISGRNLTVLLCFGIYVTTSEVCCDLIFFVSH